MQLLYTLQFSIDYGVIPKDVGDYGLTLLTDSFT